MTNETVEGSLTDIENISPLNSLFVLETART